VLRARRRIAAAGAGWALSPSGLEGLCGRAGKGADVDPARPLPVDDDAEDDEPEDSGESYDPQLAEALTAVHAAMASADRVVANSSVRPRERDPLAYDLDWDEGARIDEWRQIVDETRDLPPTLAAAIALEAWTDIEPLQHQSWFGQLLAAALLRGRGKTSHLACLNIGLRVVPRERRHARDVTTRLLATLEAIEAAAQLGLKDHDRWFTARGLLVRKLKNRRSTSRLPLLIDYVMSRPIVSAAMIAGELGISARAAQSLVAELSLREATGRGRYRAWGIL
jgi:hypothetical protein